MRVVHTFHGINEHYFGSISGAGQVDKYLDDWCQLLDCSSTVAPWIELFRILDARYAGYLLVNLDFFRFWPISLEIEFFYQK